MQLTRYCRLNPMCLLWNMMDLYSWNGEMHGMNEYMKFYVCVCIMISRNNHRIKFSLGLEGRLQTLHIRESPAVTLVERCLRLTAFRMVHLQIAYHCSWWSYIAQPYKMGCWWLPYFQYSNKKVLKTADSSPLQMHIVLQWARTPVALCFILSV